MIGEPLRPMASSPCFGDLMEPERPPEGAIGVLILAGGAGVRIGGDKPQRQLAGETLLARALRRAAHPGRPLAVSVRTGPAPAGAACVHDKLGVEGPLAGLIAGLAWARNVGARWLQLRPCDAPFLPMDLETRLYARMRTAGVRVCLPWQGERLHPACGLWHVNVAEAAAARGAAGRRSLIGLATEAGYAADVWPDDDASFLNINTPDDLVKAERLAAAMGRTV
jgi:molybdopterin-guanine dinucleotide biosynthesis protein A